MPEYHQIETHIELKSDSDFPFLVSKFKSFLAEIGLFNNEINHWIRGISWEVAENGFVYTSSAPNVKIPYEGSTLTVRPLISGITPFVFPELEHNWVSFELLFFSEEIEDLSNLPIVRYKKKPITKLLEIIHTFTEIFPESPVFLTNEAQDSEPWEGLIQNDPEKMNLFRIGSFPLDFPKIASIEVNNFYMKKDNQRIWFATNKVFTESPWN